MRPEPNKWPNAALKLSHRRLSFATTRGVLLTVEARKLPARPTLTDLGARCRELMAQYEHGMSTNPPAPIVIAVERIVMPETGRQAEALTRMHQMQGVVAAHFSDRVRVVDVPPEMVRLFATGDPKADRSLVTHCAMSRIRAVDPNTRVVLNDDQADTYHLWRMGRVAHELDEHLAGYELEAVDSVSGWF